MRIRGKIWSICISLLLCLTFFSCKSTIAVPSPTGGSQSALHATTPPPSPTNTPVPTPAPAYAQYGFVSLEDVLKHVVIEARYFSDYNFIGEPFEGYNTNKILLTKQAADALQKAADLLYAQGYMLKIYDGYRPQQSVDFIINWSKDAKDQRMKETFYPNVKKSKLFSLGYIAHKSGHTRGSTVDLTIINANTYEEVDMGTSFDFMDEASHIGSKKITAEQTKNRKILQDAMEQSGFEAYGREWWHFTLLNEPYPNTYFNFPVE